VINAKFEMPKDKENVSSLMKKDGKERKKRDVLLVRCIGLPRVKKDITRKRPFSKKNLIMYTLCQSMHHAQKSIMVVVYDPSLTTVAGQLTHFRVLTPTLLKIRFCLIKEVLN